MNKDRYRVPEMIDRNYVSAARVRDMIDKKYKKGDFYVKTIPKLNKLSEVAQNVINNMEDPKDAYKTISADKTRVFSKKLYEIPNDVTPGKHAEILKQNRAVENAIEAESEDEDDEVLDRNK
jgi:hypothetical protein